MVVSNRGLAPQIASATQAGQQIASNVSSAAGAELTKRIMPEEETTTKAGSEQVKLQRATAQVAARRAGQVPYAPSQEPFVLPSNATFTQITPAPTPTPTSQRQDLPKIVAGEPTPSGQKIDIGTEAEIRQRADVQRIKKIETGEIKAIQVEDKGVVPSSRVEQIFVSEQAQKISKDKGISIKRAEEMVRTQPELNPFEKERAEAAERAKPIIFAGLGLATAGAAPLALGAGTTAAGIVAGGGLVVAGAQGPEVGGTIAESLATKPKSTKFQRSRATQAGFYAIQSSIQQKDLFGQFVSENVPGVQALPIERQTFVKAATAEFQRQGLPAQLARSEAQRLADIELTGRGAGEVGGLVVASGGTEILGRTLVKAASKGAVQSLGKKAVTGLTRKEAGKLITGPAFKGIAPAGVVEGGVFEVIQSTARRQEVRPENVALAAGVGGVSAGIAGTLIARTAFTRPRTSKVISRTLFAIDPTEKPGDIVGGALVKEAFDIGLPIKTTVVTPAVTPSITPSITPAPTQVQAAAQSPFQTKTVTRADVKRVKAGGTTFVGAFTPSFVTTPTLAQQPSISIGLGTNTFTQTQPFVEDKDGRKGRVSLPGPPTSPTTPADTLANAYTQNQADTLTQTETQTQAQTQAAVVPTTVNVPVPVSVPTGLPLFPGGLPFGGGRGRGRARQGSRVINELQGAFKGFASEIPTRQLQQPARPRKPRKASKSRGRRR